MRQTRVAKRRPRPASWPQTPLLPDPRDPDIVRAHQVTRRAGHPRARATPGRRQRDRPAACGRPPNPARRTPCIR
jgi:hypothetical protein